MKTYQAKPGEVTPVWRVVDLNGKTLGRAASAIACLLRGKNKPQFTPHVDTGDFVVVVNADKVKMTGSKLDKASYHRHSLYPGGLRSVSARHMVDANSPELVRLVVRGMLPKSKLGRHQLKKLKVYSGAEHPHEAQQPITTEI